MHIKNYRKSDATAKQMESDVNTMIRKQYADNKPKNWSIDELVYFAEELKSFCRLFHLSVVYFKE